MSNSMFPVDGKVRAYTCKSCGEVFVHIHSHVGWNPRAWLKAICRLFRGHGGPRCPRCGGKDTRYKAAKVKT